VKESKQRIETKLRQGEKTSLQDTKTLEDLKRTEAEIRKDRLALKNQQAKTLPLRKPKTKAASSPSSAQPISIPIASVSPPAPSTSGTGAEGGGAPRPVSKIVKPPGHQSRTQTSKVAKS